MTLVNQLHYNGAMPTIKRFSNCAIEIYNREHGRPHFHVIFSDGDRCAIDIETLEVLAGEVKRPARLREALRWASANRTVLMEYWRKENR